MLSVSEAAACQEHRQVLDGVTTRIAEVAAEEDRGAVEQIALVFLRLLQLAEQLAHSFYRLDFDEFQLLQLLRIFAVM